MPFYNREKEIKKIKNLLSGEPNLVYFIYGPINSGKTALLTKVFEELSESFCVFYINFRGKYVQTVEDLIKVLFRVKRGMVEDETREIVKEFLKLGAKALGKLKGIPISESLFEVLFKRKDKGEDIFAFLEEYFEEVREGGVIPVLVIDEMQSIKEVINAVGRPVIKELFNFLVRMTKETHLCHCLCATSDCLFIEDIYANARLEGRAEYILVDDLTKEEALQVYEEFGFENKELCWDYIGGKFGDMVRLFDKKKGGESEEEGVKELYKIERGKLEWMLYLLEIGEKEGPSVEEIKKVLESFKEKEEILYQKIKARALKFLIEENVIFYNPVKGILRPQSRLLWRAIRKIF